MNQPQACPPQVYLASVSPRRQELLSQIGVNFQQLSVDVEEQRSESETPEQYVKRVALDKAQAGWNSEERVLGIPVLGADTEVVVDGQVMGKPQDHQHAMEMLDKLSGKEHQVISVVALVQGSRQQLLVNLNKVYFRDLSQEEKQAYCKSGGPLGKAGGYGIQGLAAAFISHLEGSYSGVMGLPLYETSKLLREFGIDVLK
ncbi:MAG: septum formation inhibitor Maf [Gammaproteobacteria bacterium]|nr:septum formation inhibitor Maf [Gammaproteobacteria bacterium]MCK5091330.1 septum formation inhibitor Maf [Gammaproteobacteria bacterium]